MRYVLLVISLLALFGCETFSSPRRIERLEGEGDYWISYNSQFRGALVRKTEKGLRGCSEPVPDTAMSSSTDFNVAKEAVGEAVVGNKQGVVVLPGRNENILALREALYRLCELSMNFEWDAGQKGEILTAYKDVVGTMNRVAESGAEERVAEASAKKAQAESLVQQLATGEPRAGVQSRYVLAKNAEIAGFEALANGRYEDAKLHFESAESVYPNFHSVREISERLSRLLANGPNVTNERKREALTEILTKWSWKAPKDLLERIRVARDSLGT